MRAEKPEIAWLRVRLSIRDDLRNIVLGCMRVADFIEKHIDFGHLEAGDRYIKVHAIECHQILQLDRENLFVPARILGKLIVGDHVGPNLIVGQLFQPNRRNFAHAE